MAQTTPFKPSITCNFAYTKCTFQAFSTIPILMKQTTPFEPSIGFLLLWNVIVNSTLNDEMTQ